MSNDNPRVQTLLSEPKYTYAMKREPKHVQRAVLDKATETMPELYIPPCGCLQEALGDSHLLLPVRFSVPNRPPKEEEKNNLKNLGLNG